MTAQTTIDFNQRIGENLATLGQLRAVHKADIDLSVNGKLWSKKCYNLLLEYIGTVDCFRTEQFRLWCNNKIEQPDNARSYGGIIRKAKENKIIRSVGLDKCEGVTCHSCFASVWKKY